MHNTVMIRDVQMLCTVLLISRTLTTVDCTPQCKVKNKSCDSRVPYRYFEGYDFQRKNWYLYWTILYCTMHPVTGY